VIGDNEVWRSTFGGLKTLEDKTLDDILDALKQALANNCESVRAAVKENGHLRLQLRLYTAPVENRVLALSAFQRMGIPAIIPPVKLETETQCLTAKLVMSPPIDFSEDEKEYFWRMVDTTLDIPPVERSDAESGNGRAYLELLIEPGSSFMSEPVESEPGSACSLTYDDERMSIDPQIVYTPPVNPWSIENEPATPVSIELSAVDAETQCDREPVEAKPQIEYGDQSSQTDPVRFADVSSI
jgi:hypothetical protein